MADSDSGDHSASYRLGDLDASSELPRLKAQVDLLAPQELKFLRSIGVTDDAVVADVGCGPGFFAESLAADLGPRARVIGVDVDALMIDVATSRADVADNVSFALGTAQRLPLADNSVDVAYARFLFQHLPAPAPVLAEMQRIVKPGGIVAVGDTDDGGLVLHPVPDGFDAFLAASHEAQVARGGDRRIGRKLKALLTESGLLDVHATTRVMTSEDIGAPALLAIAVGFKAGVLGPPFADPAEVRRIQSELRVLSAEPGFFGHALGYAAWGRVP